MRHTEIQDLLGVYALDALDEDEAEAVRRHLEDCPRCRTEVAEHREVAALLAYAGAPAPPHVWDRIAASLEEPPPALQLQPVPRAGRHARMVSLRAAAVAFAVAAASIIGLGVAVIRLNNRVNGQGSLAAAISDAMTAPGAIHVQLASTTHASASASAVLLPDGQGYLTGTDLTPLPAGHVYQLWGQVDGRLISLGVLGSDPKQKAFPAEPKMTLLAITAETAPGVTVSSQTPVVAGPVSA